MNIEQFELILCDMYTMDAWSPPLLWKWKKEFKEESTKQWAIRELENYIRKRLHHRSDGSVDEFIRFTNEFAMKMARYGPCRPPPQSGMACPPATPNGRWDMRREAWR